MKKIFMFFALMLIAVITLLAQEPVDSTNIDVITGGTLAEFLKNNMWLLIFIAYSALEAWFGQTQVIKEGSVLAFIWNWVGKIIKKQLPSVKGKFMTDKEIKVSRGLKILVIAILFSGLSAGVYSQGVFSQFGKITRGTKIDLVKAEGDKSIKWFVKPTAEISAMNLVYDKEEKAWSGSPFTAAGLGGGIQHYVEHNGVLANDYGFNALFIINFNDPENVGFGIAGTVNALDFVNVGGGYDFTNKVPLLLLGASWKF